MLIRLSNNELINVNVTHNQEGQRFAQVWGVGWRIPTDGTQLEEIVEELELLEVLAAEIITDSGTINVSVI